MKNSDMYHILPVELAEKYGINNAVFIYQIISILNICPLGWFTLDDLHEIFPYWSKRMIRRITKNLVSERLLIQESPYMQSLDHTLYFTLSGNIYPREEIGFPSNNKDV